MAVPNSNLSEYNQAEQWMIRIDESLRKMKYYAEVKDASGWWNAIDDLKREISTEFSEEDLESIEKEMEDVYGDIYANMKVMNRKGIMRIPPDIYKRLNRMDIRLRRVMREKNIYTKTGKDKRWGN